MIPGAKVWKPYWVDVHGAFLDISAEYGKDPFTSFHVGVLKVRPGKEYPDRPDVLEFYDGDGLTTTHFYVFTYDPFDILEFFKSICNSYKGWRDNVSATRQPAQFQCEVKPPGFFSGNLIWNVQADAILMGKAGQPPTRVPLQDIVSITPMTNPSKVAVFKFATKQNQDPVEERCVGLDQMKILIDAIYTNAFILKLPPPDAAGPAPPAGEAPPPIADVVTEKTRVAEKHRYNF
jgi:hypothetical protein